jgi:transcriptional regulator with XRE-family HTH domain
MFSERLKIARIAKGLTQQVVADHLGIKKEAFQHYEYGKRKPPYENIIKLCRLLDVSADWLLGLSDAQGGK